MRDRRFAQTLEGVRLPFLCGAVCVALALSLSSAPQARAQEELGCCQFFARPTDGATRGQRRCANITRPECTRLKPASTFFRRFRCDTLAQRCVLGPAPHTPTPTLTPTASATPTRTEPRGCCQLNDVRGIAHSVCGNEVTEASCRSEFEGTPVFCGNCACSSHPQAGFSFDVGSCVTRTPTPTATPTPAEPRGCCQLTGVRGTTGAVCGNDIRESTCLNEFDGNAVFCASCVCSSHSGSGVDLAPGVCVPPTPTRGPRPQRMRPPRPPRPPRHRSTRFIAH